MIAGEIVGGAMAYPSAKREICAMPRCSALIRASLAILIGLSVATEQSRAQTPRDDLAAQIRLQGFACDKALGATRDVKRSRPDYAVWVLKCSNAVYRVSRYPDMAAQVVPLR